MQLGIGIYIKNSVQAVELYKIAFGLELGYHVLNDDGAYFHSELCKDGETVFSVVEAETKINENPIQLCYQFETKEELEGAFNLLKESGTVLLDICELPWSPCAAEVIDSFGVRWYLSLPGYRPSEDWKPED